MASEDQSEFLLKNQDATFKARQESIFGSLSCPSSSSIHQKSTYIDKTKQKVFRDVRGRSSEDIRQYKGEESLFKKPPPKFPLPRHGRRDASTRNGIPDHVKNPHKWKRYSLESVSESDMSEKSNTAAAFAFLRELEERKRKDEPESEHTQEESSESDKIVFKKKTKQQKEETGEPNTSFQKSKVVMPTYDIGQKKTTKRKRNGNNELENDKVAKRQMALTHLMDAEEEPE